MTPGGWSTGLPVLKGQNLLSSSGLSCYSCLFSFFSLLRIMISVALIGTRRRNRCSPQICVTIILKCWLQEAEGKKPYIYTPRSQFVIEGNQA